MGVVNCKDVGTWARFSLLPPSLWQGRTAVLSLGSAPPTDAAASVPARAGNGLAVSAAQAGASSALATAAALRCLPPCAILVSLASADGAASPPRPASFPIGAAAVGLAAGGHGGLRAKPLPRNQRRGRPEVVVSLRIF